MNGGITRGALGGAAFTVTSIRLPAGIASVEGVMTPLFLLHSRYAGEPKLLKRTVSPLETPISLEAEAKVPCTDNRHPFTEKRGLPALKRTRVSACAVLTVVNNTVIKKKSAAGRST
jgi:hypothetical protein